MTGHVLSLEENTLGETRVLGLDGCVQMSKGSSGTPMTH